MPIGDPVSAMANGNILPYTAVMGDTTKDFRVVQANAGLGTEGAPTTIGIAQKGERRDPSNSDTFAAIAGELIYYFGNGAKDVPARLGVGGATRFNLLKSGADGRLIVASTDGDNVVAVAKQSGVENDIIDVDVQIRMRAS